MEEAVREYWNKPSAQIASLRTLEARIENAKYWLHYIENAGAKLYRSEQNFNQKKRSLN
jgi:hypothetical protein